MTCEMLTLNPFDLVTLVEALEAFIKSGRVKAYGKDIETLLHGLRMLYETTDRESTYELRTKYWYEHEVDA